MELTKKQLIELVQFATGKIHSSFTWESEAKETVDEYLKAINYTQCCEELCGCVIPSPIDPFAEVDKDTCRHCNRLIA